MTFDKRWQSVVHAAREAPETPLPALDVERILTARRLHQRAPSPKSIVRIGWFPPGLAAAAVVAGICAFAAGIDPRPVAMDASLFIANLPRQVPRSPAFSAPTLPSAAGLMDDMMHQSSRLFATPSESSP